MKKVVLVGIGLYFSFCSVLAFASDRTDALDLMNKCDKESKIIEVPLKNFGDEKELAKFAEGQTLIKQGKVKQAQANYADAKAKFQEYLKIQKDIYETLSAKYVERTKILIDEIAEDLADFVGEAPVLKGFTTANQNLESGKASLARKQYENVILPCRLAKNSVIGLYAMVKKDLPEKYRRDLADFENKIYEEPKAK